MRRALARLLSVALTLALSSVVALWALCELSGYFGHVSALPLYFNSAPRNVHDLSLGAVQRLTTGPDGPSERELARLGGAALPHVLPKLDTLGPSARGRVALALAPVARRMGVTSEDELGTPDGAAAFWSRFWQDRSFDFRPQVARRLVGRLAQKSSALSFDEIIQLDTYCLPELSRALGAIRSEEDVNRVARLTRILAHVTGRGPVVAPRTSVAETRRAARLWQRYFASEGQDFVTLDGPTRVVATFAQTRFGAWVGQLLGVVRLRAESGVDLGISVAAAVSSALRWTLALLLALLLGAGWARLEADWSRRALAFGRFAAALLGAIPAIFVVELAGAPRAGWALECLTVLLPALLGAALLSRAVRATLSRRQDSPRPGYRSEWNTALALAPSVVPWLLSSLFALEFSLDRQGVAKATLGALARGEIEAGMSLALGASLLTVILVTVGDRDVASARERARPSLVEVEEVSKTRPLAFGGAAVALLLLMSVRWAPAGTPGWSELTAGARDLLTYGSLSLLIATAAGLALGAAAASGPQAVDVFLARGVEVSSGFPALLWVAALTSAAHSGLAAAIGVGLLRAIDIGWILRSELVARARADSELGLRSLGRLPLLTYFQSRLAPAAIPALGALALTPAWLVGVQALARACTLRASPGGVGWDQLLARPAAYPALPVSAAVLTIVILSWLLLALIPSEPRRLGAIRKNTPLASRRAATGG